MSDGVSPLVVGCIKCGYFTKVFKKINGVTPTKYRNIIKKQTG